MGAAQTTYSDVPGLAFAGMLADGDDHTIAPMKNAEASAQMPFGIAVAFKPSAATSDQDATLPANSTDLIAGILVQSNMYDRTYTLADGTTGGELGATGVVPGAMINVLRRGVIWATCADGCAVGARLWVRYSGGTLGELRSTDAGGSTCIDATKQGQWISTAAAAGLAKLDVDFVNKP